MTETEGAARRATIYERISSDPTGRAAGVERQDEDNHALAEQLGWTVVAVRRDNDVSAYSGKPRPGFRKLLEDLREGRANAVIAWHPDRLYRRLPDLEELAKVVQEHDVVIRTVRAGAVDLSTASGIMTAEILASVSKHEIAHSIERITRAKAQAAAEGRYRGGPRPFGFETDGVTVREDEARWIRTATDAVISGESVRALCRMFNEAGIGTPQRRYKLPDGTKGEPESKEWTQPTMRRMLLRPRNCGLLEVTRIGPDGKKTSEIAGEAEWPAVVDETKWRACKDILENPGRRTTPGNARAWLLSGIARCWCGSPLKCTTTGAGGRAKAAEKGRTWAAAYQCREHSGHVVRRAVNLDEYVEGLAIYRLSREDAADILLPRTRVEPVRDLSAEANALRIKLDSIAVDYAEDAITRPQMLSMTSATRARLDQVNAEMATRSAGSVLASLPLGTPEIGKLWPGFHLDKKRAIITALMTITVHKARRGRPVGFKAGSGETYFDPDTIEISWKPPGSA